MSTEDDDAVMAAAESIARAALGEMNVNEYQALLYQIGGMLSVWKAVMRRSGYSDYFIEKSAWLMFTSFYGHHLTETIINFEPKNTEPEKTD